MLEVEFSDAVGDVSLKGPLLSECGLIYRKDYSMGLSVCPFAIVAAPVEVVWANLTEWERFCGWSGVRVKRAEPEGPAAAGQTVHFTGMGMGFTFKIEAVDAVNHQLVAHVFFPLGLQEKPRIVCTPIDATSCRVQYH